MGIITFDSVEIRGDLSADIAKANTSVKMNANDGAEIQITLDTGQRYDSEIFLEAGETYLIYAKSFSVSHNTNAYVIGDASHKVTLYESGQVGYLTPAVSDRLRLYSTGAGELDVVITSIENTTIKYGGFETQNSHEVLVDSGLIQMENKCYDRQTVDTFSSGSRIKPISEFGNVLQASSNQRITAPLKIRDLNTGELLKDISFVGDIAALASSAPDSILAICFDINGVYLRAIKASDLNALGENDDIFQSDVYFAVFVEYPHTTSLAYNRFKWIARKTNHVDFSSIKRIDEIGASDILHSGLTIHKLKTVSYTVSLPMTVFNYESYLSNATSAWVTEPVQVRDLETGELLLPDVRILCPSSDNKAGGAAYTFDKNGDIIRAVTAINAYGADDPLGADAYFAMFVLFPTTIPGRRWVTGYENGKQAYYVSKTRGADWSSFCDMLEALQGNNEEKIVYVDGGEYDIYDEMGGASYISTITNPGSMNWRDVSFVVPPNTHVKGVGMAVLKWTPPSTVIGSSDMAYLFAPLNVSGSCIIENVHTVMRNGRYGLHDETSGLPEYDGATHVYRNVISETIADDLVYGGTSAFGCGHNRNMQFVFDNCEFTSELNQGNTWWMHDSSQSAIGDESTIVFKNTKVTRGGSPSHILFRTNVNTDRLDMATLIGCVLSSVHYDHGSSSGSYRQGTKVKTYLCPQLTEETASNVTVFEPMEQYLTINNG